MKKAIYLISLVPLILMVFGGFTFEINSSGTCEIKNFYEAISPENFDTKVLTKRGNLEEPGLILIPTKLETGQYDVKLTRKGSNIYRVENTNFWVETLYCYEYATWQEAVLIVETNYGYTKGKIVFK